MTGSRSPSAKSMRKMRPFCPLDLTLSENGLLKWLDHLKPMKWVFSKISSGTGKNTEIGLNR